MLNNLGVALRPSILLLLLLLVVQCRCSLPQLVNMAASEPRLERLRPLLLLDSNITSASLNELLDTVDALLAGGRLSRLTLLDLRSGGGGGESTSLFEHKSWPNVVNSPQVLLVSLGAKHACSCALVRLYTGVRRRRAPSDWLDRVPECYVSLWKTGAIHEHEKRCNAPLRARHKRDADNDDNGDDGSDGEDDAGGDDATTTTPPMTTTTKANNEHYYFELIPIEYSLAFLLCMFFFWTMVIPIFAIKLRNQYRAARFRPVVHISTVALDTMRQSTININDDPTGGASAAASSASPDAFNRWTSYDASEYMPLISFE